MIPKRQETIEVSIMIASGYYTESVVTRVQRATTQTVSINVRRLPEERTP